MCNMFRIMTKANLLPAGQKSKTIFPVTNLLPAGQKNN